MTSRIFNRISGKYLGDKFCSDTDDCPQVVIGEGAFLAEGSQVLNCKLVLGRGARINGPVTVRGKGALFVGNFAAIGDGLRVITSNHDTHGPNMQVMLQRRLGFRSILGEAQDVTIGPATWIGDRVLILPNCSIGAGCIVGGGAVLPGKHFPPFSVIVGNPARVVKKRFSSEVIETLTEIAWWSWSEERMQRNREFFELNLQNVTDHTQVKGLINE